MDASGRTAWLIVAGGACVLSMLTASLGAEGGEEGSGAGRPVLEAPPPPAYGGPGDGDAGPAPTRRFAKGTWTFQSYGSAAFGDPGKGEMYGGHVGVGCYFADNLSLNLDGFGAAIRSGIDDDGAAGGVDLLLRGHFLQDSAQRWSIYMDGGAGLQQATTHFAGERHFNFRVPVGLGATLRLGERLDLFGGARYIHISDAGIRGGGGGFDGPLVYAGIMLPF